MELTKCSSEDRGSRESRSHNRWLDIDEAFLAQLREALEPEEKWRILNEQSALKSAEANSRSKMIQEFIFNILIFCEANNASYIEVCTAVGVAQAVFYECIFSNQSTSQEAARELFRNEMSSRIKGQPAGAFNPNFVNKFAAYFAQDVLRHLFAYQLAFSSDQSDWIVPTILQVQTPMLPPPLMSADSLAPSHLDQDT